MFFSIIMNNPWTVKGMPIFMTGKTFHWYRLMVFVFTNMFHIFHCFFFWWFQWFFKVASQFFMVFSWFWFVSRSAPKNTDSKPRSKISTLQPLGRDEPQGKWWQWYREQNRTEQQRKTESRAKNISERRGELLQWDGGRRRHGLPVQASTQWRDAAERAISLQPPSTILCLPQVSRQAAGPKMEQAGTPSKWFPTY